MKLNAWLAELDEDYLTTWANKGLLRRGYKLLEGQEPRDWTLDEHSARAHLDGFQQRLDGIGVDGLHCGCPAVGPCHHLVALLLGLRQRLGRAGTETAVADGTAPPPESSATGADTTPPWLIADPAQRRALLGKSHLERAQRWLNQGLEGEFTESAQNLCAELPAPLSARVVIPRAGGLAASLCSCQQTRCAHRALVVLQVCRQAGLEDEETGVDALDNDQREVLDQLAQWLQLLALQGMTGSTRLHLDRGLALVTELRQVDLPLPSRQLARVVEMLNQEWRRQSVSSPTRLRQVLSELHAHLSALSCQPLPQPLRTLAGEHRRRFGLRRDLELVGVAAEVWETLSGYRGYSVYFYAPEERRYYQLSDARPDQQEPDWQAADALDLAQLGQRRVSALLGAKIRLLRGWCSEDGRLSARDDCQISEPEPLPLSALLEYACGLPALARQLSDALRRNPYRADLAPYGLIAMQRQIELAFDRFYQRWEGEATDDQGHAFRITLPGTELGNLAARRLLVVQTARALFGRWRIEADRLALHPIAVWHGNRSTSLTGNS